MRRITEILSIFLLSICCSVSAGPQLISVNLLYRHGDRPPISFYPNDPYQDSSFWSAPPGELTNDGKQQHLKLGKWLRKRYDGFLSPVYNTSEIYVQSSDNNRCLMSAASNLAGLFPPQGKDVWAEDLPWQPIPIHTKPPEDDTVIEAQNSCPRYNEILENSKQQPYFKKIDETYKKLYAYLTTKTGQTVSDFFYANRIFDTLHIEIIHNLTLPDWAMQVYPDLVAIGDLSPQVFTSTPEITKVFIGRYFDLLRNHFSYFIDGEPQISQEYKFRVYSGHDDQVYSILRAVGITPKAIPYAATVIFELWKDEVGEPTVKLFYKTDEVHSITIPSCGQAECKFSKFLQAIKDVAVTDQEFRALCVVEKRTNYDRLK